jgi:hypothetical protein
LLNLCHRDLEVFLKVGQRLPARRRRAAEYDANDWAPNGSGMVDRNTAKRTLWAKKEQGPPLLLKNSLQPLISV